MGLPTTLASRALVAAFAGALAAASILPTSVVAQDRGQRPQDVEGPIWQLLKYRQDDELTLVPPGLGADVYLWAKEVRGTGACSPFVSTYTVGQDVLRIAPPEVQPATCDPEAAALDEILLRALSDVSSWQVSGSQMTLSDAAGDELLTFTNARVPEDPTIAPWRLSRIIDSSGGVSRAVEGGDAVVRFLPGGRVAGRSGCGPILGDYTTNGATIDITSLESRLTDCTGEIRTQAEELLATLPEMTDFTLRPAGFSLSGASNAGRLAFVPDIPVLQRTWTPTEVLDPDGAVLLAGNDLAASSILLKGDRVQGRSPCRLFDGADLRAGLALSLFDVKTTGSCKLPVDEDAFLGALTSVASHALRGGSLEFLDKDGAPVMKLQPQPALANVDWQLTKVSRTKGKTSKLLPLESESPLSATFSESGVVFGDTGITSFNALYDAGGSQIQITSPTPSGQTCQGRNRNKPDCRLQKTYLDYLATVDQYIVKEDTLRLYDGTRALLEFAPATDTQTTDIPTTDAPTTDTQG